MTENIIDSKQMSDITFFVSQSIFSDVEDGHSQKIIPGEKKQSNCFYIRRDNRHNPKHSFCGYHIANSLTI